MLNRLLSSALLAGCVATVACGPGLHPRSYDPPGEQLILHDEIVKSGAQDAWEAVRRLSHMTTSSTSAGEPSRMYRRGRSSLVIRETPVIVVDGVQATDLEILTQVRADQIAWIRILTGAASTTRYGAGGGAGAVIVQTVGSDAQSIASAPGQ
jgi:TonB-dependent Receptor Plug Domain